MKKPTSKTVRYIAPILGIRVTSSSASSLLNELLEAVSKENFEAAKLVVTPNPEIIMAAQKNQELARILNSAYLSVPDGVGLKVVGGVREVIPGRVLAEDIIREAGRYGLRVFLVGGKEGVAAEAAAQIQNSKVKVQKYNSKFKIWAEGGPWLDENGRPVDGEQEKIEKDAIEKINRFKPHFLFVGFGPPKQELWVSRNLPHLKVGIAMTVGGAFDYWAGKVPPPPKIVSQAGFEWLWRLITQPWRAKRIFTAVVRFPLAVLWYRLTH